MKNRALPLMFFLLLTACGFHLRGLVSFPTHFQRVAIINQDVHLSRDLILALKHQFKEQQIEVVEDPARAQYWLMIEKDIMSQQLTNVAASTTPRQYQLIYTIQFQVTQATGAVVLPPQTFTLQRQTTMNNDRILGSDFEAQTITREIYQEAAMQILIRMSSRI